MDAQLSFSSLNFAGKKKRTKRDVFLAEMAAFVPWPVLEAVRAFPNKEETHRARVRWRIRGEVGVAFVRARLSDAHAVDDGSANIAERFKKA